MSNIQLLLGNCLERMKEIPACSVDMILADLPYGTTACKWDSVIPFEPLWEHYRRVAKPSAAIVLTASQPFTSALVMSNPKMFKYALVWEKNMPTGLFTAKIQPMKYHEDILVFGNGRLTYNPIMWEGKPAHNSRGFVNKSAHYGGRETRYSANTSSLKYPKSILKFDKPQHAIHPTQKPVALMEYLIRTYTNEGETVLDNTMGSGTTGVACVRTNRNFIGIEMDEHYFEIAKQRTEDEQTKLASQPELLPKAA